MGLFGGDSIIGLDIGTSSIKAVKMQAAKKGWEIAAAAQVGTPRGAVTDGMVVDQNALLPALKHLFTRTSIRGSDAVAAVNFTSAVIVKRVGLPVLTPDALRKQIQTQPDQFGLAGGTEYIHDFQIMGAQGEGEEAQMDTVLVSAPRASVDGRLHLLESAGLDVLAVDIEPFALMRALVECKPALAALPGAIAILDLGAAHTDVTVVRGPDYIFTRAIPYGGDGLTEVVKQALQCTAEEAETLKTSVDLNWLLQGPGEDTDTSALKATNAVKSVLDDLLREVRNSIVFYQSQLPDEDMEGNVGIILLAGGTALMKGLADYMQAAFSLRVEAADFGEGFAYHVAADGDSFAIGSEPLFALAAGLAAKEVMDRAASEAASPKKPKRRRRQKEPAAQAAPETPEEVAPSAPEAPPEAPPDAGGSTG